MGTVSLFVLYIYIEKNNTWTFDYTLWKHYLHFDTAVNEVLGHKQCTGHVLNYGMYSHYRQSNQTRKKANSPAKEVI
jgi:hypothetical protein